MGEKLYYLVEVIIFSSIALVFIFSPQSILNALKLKLQKEKLDIIRVIVVIVAVLNAVINLNKFLQ